MKYWLVTEPVFLLLTVELVVVIIAVMMIALHLCLKLRVELFVVPANRLVKERVGLAVLVPPIQE